MDNWDASDYGDLMIAIETILEKCKENSDLQEDLENLQEEYNTMFTGPCNLNRYPALNIIKKKVNLEQ